MAVRRAPMMGGMGMPNQPPRMPFAMAPAGNANPAAGNAGPGAAMSGATGQPGGAAPGPGPMPPPVQPNGGGPTSPMNIQSMLHAKMGAQAGGPGAGDMGLGPSPAIASDTATPKTPLPPWGDTHGAGSSMGMGDPNGLKVGGGPASGGRDLSAIFGAGDPSTAGPGQQPDDNQSMSPLVMLKLLRAMGHV